MLTIRKVLLVNLAVIFYSLGIAVCDEVNFKTVKVVLEQGVLSGKVEESFLKQKQYYAFRGIPFAEPPLGSLRFQPPIPFTAWEGTYDAYDNKPTCAQFCTRERNAEPFGLSGSEDCLYLSVYTPALEGNYPVVVFDYNDNFRTGFNGSDTYSPDFFIEEEVIVVTISHRLGSLGYLTTEDDVIPGNNGLRDFILGLKWIKNYIQKFGGDVSRITLMGNKGGAAMAHILLYSEQAKGLFSAAIMQSGTALETLYFYQNPRSKAFQFGEVLDIETDDSKILLEKLQKVDVEKLLHNEFMIFDADGLTTSHMTVQIFVPSVERKHETAIITALPEKASVVNDVPVLIGLNSREGLDYAQHFILNPKIFEKIMDGVTMNLPLRVNFRFDRDSLVYNRDAVKEINEIYYKGGYLHLGNLLEYTVYLGDVMQGYAIDKTAKILSRFLESSVYYYLFDFRGLINENSEFLARHSITSIQQRGATTTDELCYLHLCGRMKNTYKELKKLVTEQVEFKVLKKMVRLWTNFAKTRNPTPDENDSIIKGIKWEPISKEEKKAKYLHISKKFTMKKEPLGYRAKFWDDFLEKYSNMAVDGVVTDAEGEGYHNVPFENMRHETENQTEIQNDNTNFKDETENHENEIIPGHNIEYETNENGDNVDNYYKVERPKVIVVNNNANFAHEEIRDEL